MHYDNFMFIGDWLLHTEYLARKREEGEARIARTATPRQPIRPARALPSRKAGDGK